MSTRVYKAVLENIRAGRATLHGLENEPEQSLQQPPELGEIESDADLSARASALSEEARANLYESTVADIERTIDVAFGEAWPIAKKHAGEHAVELMTQACLAIDEFVAARNAPRIFADANQMPPGTYSPATMRELYLVAVRQPDADLTPDKRRAKAIRQMAEVWEQCTGTKATASYDSVNHIERMTPFVLFVEAALAAAGVEFSLRKIRSGLHGGDQKARRKLVG